MRHFKQTITSFALSPIISRPFKSMLMLRKLIFDLAFRLFWMTFILKHDRYPLRSGRRDVQNRIYFIVAKWEKMVFVNFFIVENHFQMINILQNVLAEAYWVKTVVHDRVYLFISFIMLLSNTSFLAQSFNYLIELCLFIVIRVKYLHFILWVYEEILIDQFSLTLVIMEI